MVPFLDLTRALAPLRAEIDAAIARVVSSGRFLNGPEVEAFEAEFAAYVGVDHCVAVSSGTDALAMALRAHYQNSGSNCSTWTPQTGCPATLAGIFLAQGHPVQGDTYGGGSEFAVPVHLYGRLSDVPPAKAVVEDCAQAIGVPGAGVRHTAAWSFYPTKNLGALGDAGAVTTNDIDVAKRVRALSPYGYGPGRMDEIQAAVLRVKLPHVDRWNSERAAIASHYPDNGLRGPTNHHLYPLFFEKGIGGVEKEFLDAGVQVRRYFNDEICLPCFPGMTDAEVERVAAAAHQILNEPWRRL